MTNQADRIVDLHVRDARPGDQDMIRDVTLAAYQEYAAQMPAQHWEGYRQNILTTLAEVKPAEQIVAERQGTILGTVLLYPSGTVIGTDPTGKPVRLTWPEVRLLAVAPAQRGQGIGTLLMDECIRRARRSGATALTLHTTDLMQTAMRLYERLGFVHFAELDFHPAPGLTIKGYRLNLETITP